MEEVEIELLTFIEHPEANKIMQLLVYQLQHVELNFLWLQKQFIKNPENIGSNLKTTYVLANICDRGYHN